MEVQFVTSIVSIVRESDAAKVFYRDARGLLLVLV